MGGQTDIYLPLVTSSLLHLVILVQVLVVVLLVHPLLSQPSVPSALVAGCKDRCHRISERASIVTNTVLEIAFLPNGLGGCL